MVVDRRAPDVYIETVSHSDPRGRSGANSTEQAFGLSRLALPYNQNQLAFTYVALDFKDATGVRYQYKLDGYDSHWVDAGIQRAVRYTNLLPGSYTFEVKARNSDGYWGHTANNLVVVIDPPWWQTWWAWILWVLLFVSAVYVFIAYRSRKLIRDKKVLEHKVQVRTEEVIQQKEEIEAQRDNLEEAYRDLKTTQSQLVQREKMASLGELTAGIAHEIQNPLNFVNNFSDVNQEMLEELEQELARGDIDEAKVIMADIKQNEKEDQSPR